MHAIVNSRQDYAYVVNSLAQYLTNPILSHIQNWKEYYDISKEHLHRASNTNNHQMVTFYMVLFNVDWVGDKDTCKSTFGYCFLLVDGMIS
jgi:hypothetical protein